MDGLFAFLGAFVGGVAAGLVNWFLIDKQHRHAKELQDRQFAQSERTRELEQRYARGNQIAEWDQQRQERERQRELDRQREYERGQLEATRALELSLLSFSRAARVLFEAKQKRHAMVNAGETPTGVDADELQTYVTQFNDLRYVALGNISRIDIEKLRRRAAHLYALDESMALSDPQMWGPGGETFGGHNPILLQVTWQEQFLRIVGKIYRNASIEGEFVEEHQHFPDPRKSERPESPVID